jgi:hypothetical protein
VGELNSGCGWVSGVLGVKVSGVSRMHLEEGAESKINMHTHGPTGTIAGEVESASNFVLLPRLLGC